VHERPDDLDHLQRLLDESYRHAGDHLREIHAPERRLDAERLAELLTGMRLLTLATVTRDGRPITGPVDGVFYRGAFHFGSSPASLRFRHLAERPHVSATHLPGEYLAVSVHGRAERVDVAAPEHAEFRQTLLDLYLPLYGESWRTVLDGAAYARIDATRIFTFWMPEAHDAPHPS
jgi:nitroimidazol reductase NimA-like FMN-containing flavoprotein (pyridoxamine 5'-phosphate oxidase superfamily)